MNKISQKPFVAAEYLTEDFSDSCLGSAVTALVTGDVPQLAKEMAAIQGVGSGVAATLNLIADAVLDGGNTLDDERRARLGESLQLMASLTRFCVDASEAVIDADYRVNGGGLCH